MSIYINGHALNFDHDKNGVRLAECGCGAPIHKRMPNRRQPNITLEEFMREANVKHQQHLANIDARENLMRAFKNSPNPKVDYAAMENEFKGCPAVRMERGAHRYKTLNTETIYCTQCGDTRRIGGVVEDVNMDLHKANSDLRAELEKTDKDKSYFQTLAVERGKEILTLKEQLSKTEVVAKYWSSWANQPDIRAGEVVMTKIQWVRWV